MFRRLASLGGLLAVLLLTVRGTVADDVPDSIRDLYAEARVLQADGELEKAYSVLCKARSKQPLSVDYWELFVRVWRGLDKKEDILWRKIVGKVEAKHPDSAVFALLRARLADEPAERIGHLREAVAKEPEAIRPRLLLAKAVFEQGDDLEAEELLDAVLEHHPGNEEALVTKGELDLLMGRSLSAVDYAEERLREHPLAGLHDLRARALLAASESGDERLDEAEKAARRATEMREDPRFLRTLVDVLHRRGKVAEAVKRLDEGYARYPAPELAAKLGELAFENGDYERAIRGLAADPEPSNRVLKGLAVAYGRLGDVDAMRKVLARLERRLAERQPYWTGRIELAYGDPVRALQVFEDASGDEFEYLHLRAHARLGEVEAACDLAGERARGGARADEEYLLQILHAHLVQRLGAKAGKTRAALRNGSIEAAKASIATAQPAEEKITMRAHSPEYMERAVSYRRSAGGQWFHATFEESELDFDLKRRGPTRAVVRLGIQGHADCKIEPTRWFWFNSQEISADSMQGKDPEREAKELVERLFGVAGPDVWESTRAAFEAGCAALVDASWSTARSKFEEVLQAEPEWARAQLFGAVALVLDGGDDTQAVLEAKEAIEKLPDDYDGQRLLVLLQACAGADCKATVKDLARKEEAHRIRKLARL